MILNAIEGKNDMLLKTVKTSPIRSEKNRFLLLLYVHVSFDVKSLFTCIPVDYALHVIRKNLLNDDSWNEKTD